MRRRPRFHAPGLLASLFDLLRGRDQLLIRAGDDLPLVVASYPRGSYWMATALQSALGTTFRGLSAGNRDIYHEVLTRVPSLVVVEVRSRNTCTCLGHHHPTATHSRLARRLSDDTGQRVGEIDLAVDAIRRWEPLPLSDLAVLGHSVDRAGVAAEFAYQRFHTALLAIFLHELEHLAFPQRAEAEIRRRSDGFYVSALRDFVSSEFGQEFGIEEKGYAKLSPPQ